MAAMIACLGLIYSTIFRLEVAVYLPVMAASFICWTLIASLVNESATVFIEAEGYLRSAAMPSSTYIFKTLLRNLLYFAHNLILVPVLMLIFGLAPSWTLTLFLPAILLVFVNALWIAMFLGVLCIRFRDMSQIVANIVQVAFFVSPVIWARPQLGAEYSFIVDYNPFAIFLELLREPILGSVPSSNIWISGCIIAVVGFVITMPFYARFRPRLSYYV